MPEHTVRFPTHVGAITIEFGAAGPVHTWRGPAVFFSVNHMPAVSVVMENGKAVIDVMGHEPQMFDQLPEDLRLAATWWQQVLPTLADAWGRFADTIDTDHADAA